MPPRKKLAILTDFDGTAAEQNVAEMLIERFNHADWRRLYERYQGGDLSLKEYQETGFKEIEASKEEMGQYVKERATLRPGFPELAGFCREKGIPLAVVTFGLDLYVDPLLEKHSLEWLPCYSAGVSNGSKPMKFSYPYATPWCWHRGNCKCLILDRYVREGYSTVYIGDGLTDLCPAQRAYLILARSTLLEHCRRLGIPHKEFHDFYQVKTLLREEFGYD